MQNILVPTDFSNNAYHALRYAAKLLKDRECNFFLLNVYNKSEPSKVKRVNEDDMSIEKLKERSKARLGHTVNRIKKQNKNSNHSYSLISKNGDFIEVVHSLVDKLEIELLVMGSKGKKSSIPILLGSTASKTLKSIKKCPVLVVPKGAGFTIPKQIAFASDFKNSFDEKIMDSLRYIALLHNASIKIVHINEQEQLNDFQQSNLNVLLGCLEPISHSVIRMPNFISKTKVIQIFLEDQGIDILGMVNNEHGFLQKMLREPIIEKMVFNINIPFLVIPPMD